MTDSSSDGVERFTHAGLPCKIVQTDLGHWCGYAKRPESVEPVRWTSDYDSKRGAHEEIVEADVDVWGGITYGPDADGWVGFDDGHARSLAEHRDDAETDKDAVRMETKRLAEQIRSLQASPEDDDPHPRACPECTGTNYVLCFAEGHSPEYECGDCKETCVIEWRRVPPIGREAASIVEDNPHVRGTTVYVDDSDSRGDSP